MVFSTHKEMDDEHLYMDNTSTSKVLGIRKVMLKMYSGKLFTPINVLYVTKIREKLVFDSLLRKIILKWSLRVIKKIRKYII
jgi:hypothetical protein